MQTGRMTIGVELFADHFFVEARIERAEPGEISFLLNADLALEGAASGGAAVDVEKHGWNNGICAEMACLNFYSAYVP